MKKRGLIAAACAFAAFTSVNADQVINDDLIVTFSECVGTDCVNGENFGFDTIRLKENNLRIRAFDTSNSGSFPTNDWELTFNDSANGGANRFSVRDIDAGRDPFTIEAGAPANSLYVDNDGKVGFGTSAPVVQTHVKDGNTPALRLEQDGSSGFTSQIWDLAGNETNFFVRDVTHSSKLPFRIKPGAPSNSIYIDADGDIGLGTTSPDQALDIERAGVAGFDLNNTNSQNWRLRVGNSGNFVINIPGSDTGPNDEFVVLTDGVVRLGGDCIEFNEGAFHAVFTASGVTHGTGNCP